MKTYAFVQRGEVVEIIPPVTDSSGKEIGIQDRYAPDFAAVMYDISGLRPQPEQGWTYIEGVFAAPVPYRPTPEEILARNKTERDRLLAGAALAIAPLQDAVDLDDARPAEVALLKKWKQYRVEVNRVDLTAPAPAWPTKPE